MFIEKKRRIPYIEAIIALLVYIFHYTGLIDITISTASPIILLPLIVAVAMFYSEFVGLIFGLCCGIAADAVAASTSTFNTLSFMLIGFFVGLLAKRIFNRNLRGAVFLSFFTAFIYFSLKWIITCIIPDVQGKVYYLFWHIVPSAIYTILFIFPFYFLELKIHKEKRKETKVK